MPYMVIEIEGIGPAYADALKAAGITNTGHLLTRCCTGAGRVDVAAKTGLDISLLLEWANMADMMRIKGIGGQYAELLAIAGVDTLRALAARHADELTRALAEANAARKLVRQIPTEPQVARWIAHAKAMDARISH